LGLLGVLLAAGACLAADPFLKVVGRDIRDGRGKGSAVVLRGTNLGSWLVMEGWMCPMDSSGLKDDFSVREMLIRRFGEEGKDKLLAAYQDNWITETDLDNIAAMGMNVVRLPFWYRNLETERGKWRRDAFRRMDWLVDKAWRRGIYTILDLHGAPGGQSDGGTTGRVRKKKSKGPGPELWTKKANLLRTTRIWQRVAAHYKGKAAVAAYDLLNEPTGAPNRKTLWATYHRLYKAIRAVDPDHIITVEGCWGGHVDGQYMGWGWRVLPPPRTARWTNVLYQVHSYEWDWNNLDKQIRNVDAQVADLRAHKAWNVPCFMGEFNPMGQEKAWKYAIEQYSAHGMSWAVWSWKAIHGSGSDSWGVYNPRQPLPPKPDIQNDSAEAVREKWSRWGTSAFAINPMLKRTVGMPVPVNDAYTAVAGKTLAVDAPGILANDKHLNLGEPGVRLTARKVSEPSRGKLVLSEDGSFTYTPRSGSSGTDEFRYRAFDGRLDSAFLGTVTIRVGK